MAICPYYKDEEKQKVYCEGLCEQSSIHLAFASPPQRREFERSHCKSWEYEKCPLAQMHKQRYDH